VKETVETFQEFLSILASQERQSGKRGLVLRCLALCTSGTRSSLSCASDSASDRPDGFLIAIQKQTGQALGAHRNECPSPSIWANGCGNVTNLCSAFNCTIGCFLFRITCTWCGTRGSTTYRAQLLLMGFQKQTGRQGNGLDCVAVTASSFKNVFTAPGNFDVEFCRPQCPLPSGTVKVS
jgi:hypothetical protein